MRRKLSVGVVMGLLLLAVVGGRSASVAGSVASASAQGFGTRLWLPPAAFNPLEQIPAVNSAYAAVPQADLFVAQLDLSKGVRQSQDAFFAKAATVNGHVLGYLPEAAYLIRVSQPGAQQLKSATRAIVAFHPAYKVTAGAAKSSTLTVVALPDSSARQLVSELQHDGIEAVASSDRIALVKNRPGLIRSLAYDARVLAIEPRGSYRAFNTDARWVTQSGQRDYTPLTNAGLNGTNEAVGIADTGNDYFPDQVGQANYYFSDCQQPLTPTPTSCKRADYTYEAPSGGGDLINGTLHNNLTGHRKMLAYFDEVGDGDPNTPQWHGDSGSSTHGSHVSGSVAGSRPVLNTNGTVNSYPGNQPFDGQAPKAKIVFQDIGTDGETLNGLPGDLYLLFDQAYDLGNDASSDSTINFGSDPNPANAYQRGLTPRVHSNSWGSFIPEVSLGNSPRLDDFVVGHEDFLPVFAAGNSGPDGASIGEPGTAKDALTVGATANGRDDYASLDAMANFSSHGAQFVTTTNGCQVGTPTPLGKSPAGVPLFACPETGAIKPDVATPGLHMISAKGGTDTAVQVLQGTSMATPTAAGDAVLVRQYFDDGFGPANGSGFAPGAASSSRAYNASAALVKAVMIASAQRMRGWYTGDLSTASNHTTDGQWPSSGQGWGRVQLDSALHFSTPTNSPQLYLQDVTYALGHGGTDGIQTGEERSYTIKVGGGQPLRAVLDWSDPGGISSFLGLGPEALTNQLQLEVDDPSNNRYCGNNISTRNVANAGDDLATSVAGSCNPFVVGTGGSSTDVFNNVQVVYLPNPAPGTYTIRVQGLMVAQPQDTVGLTVGGSGFKQGFALAATGNLAPTNVPNTIAGTPPPSGGATVTGFKATAVSGDAAVLRWTTDRLTTSAVTISGPGVGATPARTEEDEYTFEQRPAGMGENDYPGLQLTQTTETDGKTFLHRPVISTKHEIKLTGLQAGGSYQVVITVNGGQSTGFSTSFKTPATSYAPQVAGDTATLFSGPAGAPLPITDPTSTDPWGNSSQLYIGVLPPTPLAITPPPLNENALGAFKFVTPANAPTNNLAGAAVLLASRHDITSHDQELPATSLDLLPSQPDGAGWGTGTGYGIVSGYAAIAHLFPNFGHLRSSALTWEPYTLTCNDLTQLTSSITTNQQARFRVSATNNHGIESVYGFESGFGRRSTGLEYRPLLVLYPTNADPLRQPGGTPQISDVRVERQDNAGTVVVYWQTAVAANSIVLVQVGADSYQVGSPAYSTAHQVQLNGVAPNANFAVRSVSSTGQMVTSGAYAVPNNVVLVASAPPPAPASAQPGSGSFSTTPTHQFATANDKAHGTGYGCGTPPPPPPPGTCHEGDGQGSVQGNNGGNANFESDEDSCEDGDQNGEQMKDPGSHEDFHSTQVQSVQFDDATGTMTTAGVGVSNGLPVTFLIIEQAATVDTPAVYTIQLSDGYVNTGTLLSGAITLR
jgi:hypothetical protein